MDAIRIYAADAIECTKCDNWEEGSAPWSSFKWHDKPWTCCEGDKHSGYYTCSECGSACVKESSFEEYRDYE